MSQARAQMLDRIRRSLGAGAADPARAAAVTARLEKHPSGTLPGRVPRDAGARASLFADMAREAAASVARVSGLAAVPEAVADFLRAHNLPQRLRRGADALLADLPWDRAPSVELTAGPAEETDQVGLACAFAGAAETGTLVLTSGPDNPTSLNFLPETEIVVVPASRVAGTYEEVWARLRADHGPGTLPRTVNFITGPSRTGDINQTIILGAHGPRRLHIILVEGA
jgi:L-lactate dehydrogenase complex protein LldG